MSSMFSTVPEYLFTDSFIPGMANSVLEKEENIPKRGAHHLKYLCLMCYSRLQKILYPSSKTVIPVFQKCYPRLPKMLSRLPKILFPSSKTVIPVFQKCYSHLPKMLFLSSKNVIPVFQNVIPVFQKCYSHLPKILSPSSRHPGRNILVKPQQVQSIYVYSHAYIFQKSPEWFSTACTVLPVWKCCLNNLVLYTRAVYLMCDKWSNRWS